MDPVDALIGSLLLGAGVLILFGAIRNRRVFGATGLLSTALTTGSIANAAKVPEAFGRIGGRVEPSRIGGRVDRGLSGLVDATDAVTAIAVADPSLAAQIQGRVILVTSGSTREDLMPLAQLLVIADAKGFTSSTDIIRAYVKEVCGESI